MVGRFNASGGQSFTGKSASAVARCLHLPVKTCWRSHIVRANDSRLQPGKKKARRSGLLHFF
jgi:hypothetical protein